MRARYARLLAARYSAVLETDEVDLTYLYHYLYPGIMHNVQAGKTSMRVGYPLKESVEKVLLDEGFAIRQDGSLTTIDWSKA